MLRISEQHRSQLIALARKEYPREACGLLAGEIQGPEKILRRVYPLRNIDQNPERHFTMAVEEQLRVVQDIRQRGFVLLGNFHSHSFSPARPSEEDVRLALDPSLSYLIVSLQDQKPAVKSFLIRDGTVWEEIQRELSPPREPSTQIRPEGILP